MSLIKRTITVVILLLGPVVLLLTTAVLSTSAQTGTVITRAVLSIRQANNSTGTTVYAHPITAAWTETVTWNSFANSFSPTVLGSFVTSAATNSVADWRFITITDQVQAWVTTPSQNFGLLLEQGNAPDSRYTSSEGNELARPRLDVWYTRGGGPETHITIQRGNGASIVTDAYIWEAWPNYTGGNSPLLETGYFDNGLGDRGIKYAMLRFELTTPTAVSLQSLSARAVPASGISALLLGTVGLIGVVVWRKRSR